MIRIAIVDDELVFAEQLKSKICKLLDENRVEYQINIFSNAHDYEMDHINMSYHLAFLDIDLPKMSGIELASRIRTIDQGVTLVFVSNYNNFVFETFKFTPFRFLRKEMLDRELPETIESYCRYVLNKKPIVELKLDDKRLVTENTESIVCFFSLRHDIYYATLNGSKRLYPREYTLERIEKELEKYGFLRIHKTYLVNYRFICFLAEDYVKMTVKGFEHLPLSRRRISEIKKQYHRFMRDGDRI